MSTRRNKVVSPPVQPELTPEQKLANTEAEIARLERILSLLKQGQAQLRKIVKPVEQKKLWQCRFCPAQIPYSEVYKHTQEHFESEVSP